MNKSLIKQIERQKFNEKIKEIDPLKPSIYLQSLSEKDKEREIPSLLGERIEKMLKREEREKEREEQELIDRQWRDIEMEGDIDRER
jgi:flagellar biosynthesis GTPase FlhF